MSFAALLYPALIWFTQCTDQEIIDSFIETLLMDQKKKKINVSFESTIDPLMH